jgi:hypothetical protein
MIHVREVEVSDVDVSNKKNTVNVIPLSGFLKEANSTFRTAVLEALAQECFELDEALPNLQLAREILDAIDWLESRGYGRHWTRFEEALLEADRRGILVDLGAFGHEIRLLEVTD